MRALPIFALTIATLALVACEEDSPPTNASPPHGAVPILPDGGAAPTPGVDAAPEAAQTVEGLYVADFRAGAILRLDLEDGTIHKTFGKSGAGRGEFLQGNGIAASDAHIFIADRGNHRIVRLVDLVDADWTEWKISDAAQPYDVAVFRTADGSERLLFSDYNQKQYFFGDGKVFSGAPTAGAAIQFNACGVALKADGEAGSAGCSTGFSSNVIFTPSSGEELHKAGFNRPDALAYLPDGTLVIADTGNSRVVCALGASTGAFGTNGINGDTQFLGTSGVATDKKGRIFVADSGRNRIVRFDDCKGANPKVLFDDKPEIQQLGGLATVGPR